MKYERKSFSVGGPIKVTEAEWRRIFGDAKPDPEVAIIDVTPEVFGKGGPATIAAAEKTLDGMMREELRYLITLAEAKAADLEADFERAAADRDTAQAECAELRAKLLLAEMQLEALRKGS